MDFVRTLILKDYPNAHVVAEPTPNTTGALEVTVNGQLVHSKLTKGDGVVNQSNAAAFMDKVRKAGRSLPKKVRVAAEYLADAQQMAQNPKLLVQLDEGEVAANYDTCIRHLGGINRGAARKSAVLGAAASAAFAIFIVMLLAIAVIYWRGLI